jgi:hypothetical protein
VQAGRDERGEPLIASRLSAGVIEAFFALERVLDPATREPFASWIEKDIYVWRVKAMLGYPPIWRLKLLARPRSASAAPLSP